MSYQVLARKWRPKRFSELVGQEHVVRALTNALDSQRMHHAFLFTGTRGVGKTTIARIFAKSLNCEKGQSSNPCGECSACRDVDAGRFMDLLEIDAASNTGVDDVREVIENAQYSPSRGRFKVYLIDEVHMLSKPAFNALLKTLEEPPAHVKFLLATTDPQKLPVTVLSRCLKFSLKRLSPEQIGNQMLQILVAENIDHEAEAIGELARSADGSLRDGLSLLDQAIAYGAGAVRTMDVRAMLGTIERGEVLGLLEAIGASDGSRLLAEVERISEFSPDFGLVLDELAAALHGIQLQQLVPQYNADDGANPALRALAQSLSAEEVQLYYQLAIVGRRDLPLAPSVRAGFEMALLRMLAFRPLGDKGTMAQLPPQAIAAPVRRAPGTTTAVSSVAAAAVVPAGARSTAPSLARPATTVAAVTAGAGVLPADESDWSALIRTAGLGGPVGQLAQHSALLGWDGDIIRLVLKPGHEHFVAGPLVGMLEQKLSAALARPIKVRFEKASMALSTPADVAAHARSTQQQAAEIAMREDPVVQSLMQTLGARIVPNSIKPVENGP